MYIYQACPYVIHIIVSCKLQSVSKQIIQWIIGCQTRLQENCVGSRNKAAVFYIGHVS